MLKDVEAALKGFLKSNQKILVSTKIDPNIIGGMIVTIGDKYVDMSIASKVRKYSKIIGDSAWMICFIIWIVVRSCLLCI